MKGFRITTHDGLSIRFQYYEVEAPVTSAAFHKLLPFSFSLLHARVSGQEIWAPDVHQLDIIQENASVFTQPGEVVLGPLKPLRVHTARALGIYYGEGKGLDSCNIFARVLEEETDTLRLLGERIWRYGTELLDFSVL